MSSPDNSKSYKDNLSTTTVGRNLTIASVVLFLQLEGYLALNKLPFIGVGITGTKAEVAFIIFVIVCYFMYKFTVYRKSEESFSRSNELTLYYVKKYFEWIGTKTAQKAKAAIWAGYNNVGRVDVRPVLEQTNNPDWTRYDLATVSCTSVSFPKLSDVHERLRYGEKKDEMEITVFFIISYGYSKRDAYHMSSSSTQFTYALTYSEYIRIHRVASIISYFRLPDFLEKTFPYLLGVSSILNYLLSV
ncbi:hypothetical protein DBT82_RS09425 [Vibrio parahaemolyticus]|uniref:hypothetical protein n=1 Tax=Vibrio parahaemolyticus TaxID=670 RepID=UPI0006A64A96|nr:hypothetical protein [Vibrio parahaemolyticus]EGR1875649.1 hypothetical protein [Vibrio parahaemolyticus]EHU5130230.1 hypothetical protein [Vibrio parahaemolyticus]EJE4707300.1 hypothetical protein [Vibrio parahaemolyticus]EJG0224601.1 hypothetical protein [Vibrio parahaemolyticus]EJG0348824.1 hypothetical protein [Vibrio parahaemolyticus]